MWWNCWATPLRWAKWRRWRAPTNMKSSPGCAGCRGYMKGRAPARAGAIETSMNFFASIGRAVMTALAHIGRLALFTARALAALVSPPIYTRLILSQMMRIGYYSLPVVGLTAFFTGGVLALQIFLGGNRFGAEAIVPQVVVIGITRELGPVIAGLMIAGRVARSEERRVGKECRSRWS